MVIYRPGSEQAVTYLLQLGLHAGHQHDAGDAHSQQQEEGVDEPSHRGVVPAGAAPTQQAGGAAAQARDLQDTRHTRLTYFYCTYS